MMINKIKSIKNLAVFQNFIWDKSLVTNGNIYNFKWINIIYGRNYSGKTTLSRIVRALETGSISDKYDNPQFEVEFDDGTNVLESNLQNNKESIRVFNEDFVNDNLSFITNPDSDIESFAVLGDDNNKIEQEIAEIIIELGANKEGEEKTGLYKAQQEKKDDCDKAYKLLQSAKSSLDNQLSQKATGDRNIAIKYKANIYGDQNYNKTKLEKDINDVLSDRYNPITDENKDCYLNSLKETSKDNIIEMNINGCNFSDLASQTNELLEKKIGKSEKIEELIKDAVLNKWVEEGRQYHKEKHRDTCAFCGSLITPSRWDELDKHFDEESTKLRTEIDILINKIKKQYGIIEQDFVFDKNKFYFIFQPEIEELISEATKLKSVAEVSLDSLVTQLQSKSDNLFDAISFNKPADFSMDLKKIIENYNKLSENSNSYTKNIKSEQDNAKKILRLKEVYDFITTIKYTDVIKNIESLEKEYKIKEHELRDINSKIQDKENLIEQKKLQMNDEEKGAEKVNEYLANFFGHRYLSLRAIKQNSSDLHYKFEIIRDNKKAFHLSEGECSLIAFCYFMARLEDISTKDKTPIIWIDDPISSLDSNHIFFVYSLINGQIVQNKRFSQLFISTHNLDFLKYLKRLPGANSDDNKREDKKNFRYLIIKRTDETSQIELMPKYMKDYVTEFNYLFKQIYQCSTINEINDANYTVFYNFGNNARKFLELYLYYKYPDNTSEADKLAKFFGNKMIPPILTNRLNNEYSHLSGIFERGSTLVEVPEMKTVASLIVNTIKNSDEDQYNALLNSINITNT